MIFKVTMKTPDALNDALREAVKRSVQDLPLSADEKALVAEERFVNERDACRWFEHGEYLTVEVDTEANTCRVVPYDV